MNEDVAHVVAYRPTGDPQRERCWAWVRQRSRAQLPDAELVIGDTDAAVFSHAAAFNAGARAATAPLLVFTDSDTAVDQVTLAMATAVVRAGQPWVMAEHYVKLTEAVTDCVVRTSPAVTISYVVEPMRDAEWIGRSWAGFLVIRRDAFLDLGGYDERITGWGADDSIMGVTLTGLLGDQPRVPGSVWHLWHDTAYEQDHGMDAEQHALVHRYEQATTPDLVRAAMGGKP